MEKNKNTLDLGEKKGKLLIFGGVYSNLHALQRLKNLVETENIPPENVICTGDVVGYCAHPEECVQEIKKWGIHSIAGNVEIQLAQGAADCGCDFSEGSRCDNFSKEWYPFAQQKLSKYSIRWMEKLPEFISFLYAGKKVLVVHGSTHETSEFIFKSTPWGVKDLNFHKGEADVILAGHSGLPFADQQSGKIWLNAGVVGMPANDGLPHVWCLVLEDVDGEFKYQFKTYTYDHEEAATCMRNENLPEAYARTLSSGLWDNCEILPPAETAMKGKEIKF